MLLPFIIMLVCKEYEMVNVITEHGSVYVGAALLLTTILFLVGFKLL